MKRTIIIMAKVPRAGAVKTRLHSILTPEKSAALAAAFLQDTLTKAATACKNIILAYSPAGEREVLKNLTAGETVLLEQAGANLGERMKNAFQFAFERDARAPVVMIGTDSPTFPAEYLAEAFAALENDSEIALGNCADGGFYLIGLRKLLPGLFARVEWSTPRVFEQITGNIKTLRIENLHLLPAHYDVDEPEDFLRLKRELSADENLQKLAAKTYRWLTENDGAS